jgi:hypothetical protein
MTKPPLLPETSQPDDGGSSDAGYAIGYGRPPVRTRFKPAHSGNPKGRPKRHRNVRTVVEEALNQKVKLKEGDKTRSVTKLEAVVQTIVNGALQRDPKAQVSLMALVRSVGMMGEAPEPSNSEPFTANDGALIADYFRRHSAASEQPDDPEGKEGSTVETTPRGERAAS